MRFSKLCFTSSGKQRFPERAQLSACRTAEDAAALAVNGDIVVVADRNLPGRGVEKDVAEGDVAVTEALGVQPEKGLGQLQPGEAQHAEARIDAPLHQVHQALVARLAQGHQIAEADCAGGGRRGLDQFQRPEEPGARRTLVDQNRQGLALGRGRLLWEVPLECKGLALDQDAIDLALPAAAEEGLDGAGVTARGL